MKNDRTTSPTRWLIIALAALTAIVVIALPTMSLTVLFDEIATDLNLTLVQVGWIWGISSFTGLFISLAGGVMGDRYGAYRVLAVSCFMVGIFGATRGLTDSFWTFMLGSFMMGLFAPPIGVNLHKVGSEWFSKRQLGLANGIISSGFALGFLLGTAFAARTLSPLLGGWRPVLYVYGAASALVGLIWWFITPNESSDAGQKHNRAIPLREGLPHVARNRTVWLIGLGKIGFWGCVRGFTGYLPLYLGDQGWGVRAGLPLTAFFAASLSAAILIPMLSDRLGVRKPFLIAGTFIMGASVLAIGFTGSSFVWVFVIISGLTFDAMMGITITSAIEAKNIGPAYAGTAIGLIGVLQEVGGLIAPPLGNALAGFSAELPFFFWGIMGILGVIPFLMIRAETRSV